MKSDHYFQERREFRDNLLDIESFPGGEISYGSIDLFSDPAHAITHLPIMIAKGTKPGPVLGLLGVVHGNELNGMITIHELFSEIDVSKLSGTVIGVPVVNMHGYLTKQRFFLDSKDLNRVMPGKKVGTPAEIYAYRLWNRVISKFDYMIDIHTASFGRINSHYVRADMTIPEVRMMAELQDAEIIVNTNKPLNSFRGAACSAGIPAITIELGNPQLFQKKMVNSGIEGIKNVMSKLQMLKTEIICERETVKCVKSYWIRVDQGGVLYVYPNLKDQITKGEEIAHLTDIFGNRIKSYYAPENGIVVGKSTNPVVYTGGRILHLGIIGENNSEFIDQDDDIDDNEDY